MSYSYHPVAMFGIKFAKNKDARVFVTEHSNIVVDEDESLKEQVNEFFSNGLKMVELNMFSTQDSIVGFHMALGETVDKYLALWNSTFPESTLIPTTILEIEIR